MSPSKAVAHMRADEVLRGLSRIHTGDFWTTEVKDGPTAARNGGAMRIDGVAISRSWAHPRFVGYEVKVSRSDWLRDDKWHAYTEFCHEFYIACPSGLIQPEEVPQDVGLAWVSPDTLHVTRKRKAVFQKIEPDAWFLMYLIYSKLDSDRYPFFSSAVEYWEAFVRSRAHRHNLGAQVSGALKEHIEDLTREVVRARDQIAEFERVKSEMRSAGLEAGEWGTSYTLRNVLREWRQGGGTPEDLRQLRYRLQSARTQIDAVIDGLTSKAEKAELAALADESEEATPDG